MPLPRVRLRTLMVAVAVAGLVLGAIAETIRLGQSAVDAERREVALRRRQAEAAIRRLTEAKFRPRPTIPASPLPTGPPSPE